MKLKEIIGRIYRKYPVFTLHAGTVKLVSRKDSEDFASEQELEEFINNSIKTANPQSEITVDLFRRNGKNAVIHVESWQVELPQQTVVPPLMGITLPQVNTNNPLDQVWSMQLQIINGQLTQALNEIERLKSQNREYETSNREMSIRLATFDDKKSMDMTLAGIESQKTFGSVFEKVLDSGILEKLVEGIGSGGGGSKVQQSEIVSVLQAMIDPLDPEHQKHIIGIVKVYAAEDPMHAQQLFNQIYNTAQPEQTQTAPLPGNKKQKLAA